MFAIRRPRASCNVPRVIQIVDRNRVGRRIRRRRDRLRVSDLAIIRRRRAADVDKQNYSRENSKRTHGKPSLGGSKNLSEQKKENKPRSACWSHDAARKKKISKAGSERLARPLTPASSLHLVQASVDEQAGHHQKDKARCSAEDCHRRADLAHLGQGLSLARAQLRGSVVPEKLSVVTHG